MRLRNIPRADGVIDAHRTVIKKREFDTLKFKKAPQSLEIGLFFCQFFCFYTCSFVLFVV